MAAAITGGKLTVAHVGCMRAYLLRDGRLSQVTRDHSLANAVLDAVLEGEVSPEDVESALSSMAGCEGLRVRMLGAQKSVEPGQCTLPLRRGDRLLLCSYQLGHQAGSDALRAALLHHADPEEVCPHSGSGGLRQRWIAAGGGGRHGGGSERSRSSATTACSRHAPRGARRAPRAA